MPLIVMAGLPGTGKTTLAKAVMREMQDALGSANHADQADAPVLLNKDVIRAALFPPDLIEYSTAQDDFCMDIMLRVAAYHFRKTPDRFIFFDGRTFRKRYQVQAVEDALSAIGIQTTWIACTCEPEIAKKRLSHDQQAGQHPARNREPSLYDRARVDAEPLHIPHLTVDTSQPLDTCVADILAYLSISA